MFLFSTDALNWPKMTVKHKKTLKKYLTDPNLISNVNENDLKHKLNLTDFLCQYT